MSTKQQSQDQVLQKAEPEPCTTRGRARAMSKVEAGESNQNESIVSKKKANPGEKINVPKKLRISIPKKTKDVNQQKKPKGAACSSSQNKNQPDKQIKSIKSSISKQRVCHYHAHSHCCCHFDSGPSTESEPCPTKRRARRLRRTASKVEAGENKRSKSNVSKKKTNPGEKKNVPKKTKDVNQQKKPKRAACNSSQNKNQPEKQIKTKESSTAKQRVCLSHPHTHCWCHSDSGCSTESGSDTDDCDCYYCVDSSSSCCDCHWSYFSSSSTDWSDCEFSNSRCHCHSRH